MVPDDPRVAAAADLTAAVAAQNAELAALNEKMDTERDARQQAFREEVRKRHRVERVLGALVVLVVLVAVGLGVWNLFQDASSQAADRVADAKIAALERKDAAFASTLCASLNGTRHIMADDVWPLMLQHEYPGNPAARAAILARIRAADIPSLCGTARK